MTNALQHSRTRYPGIVNPSLAFVDNSLLLWHTIWADTDGNYGYPGISKTGDTPEIDYGDGTIELLTGTHSYADNSTKTAKLSSTDGWSGLTELRLNWGKCVGVLPSPYLLINLVKYVCDSNQFTGIIPSFDHCNLLEEFHVEGNLLTGSVPSFALCTALKYFYAQYNGGLTGNLPSFSTCTALERIDVGKCGFSGTMPSFNTCTLLNSCHVNVNHFNGTLPSFSGCINLTSFMANNDELTDYTSGCFSTQANLDTIYLHENSLTQSAVDSILSDLVISLGISGRVVCVVSLDGGTNASPSSMTDHNTLESAGWTVNVN
jgi:hypothetical protein